MFTAIMKFHFKDELFERGCALWLGIIPDAARNQPGCVQIQFLTSKPYALAIGTWEKNDYAQEFMKTGIFDRLLATLKETLAEQPEPSVWTTSYLSPEKQ